MDENPAIQNLVDKKIWSSYPRSTNCVQATTQLGYNRLSKNNIFDALVNRLLSVCADEMVHDILTEI